MKENWGRPGMPPIWVDVLDRQVVRSGKSMEHQVIYVRGHHQHLGKLHQGWSGPETIVERNVVKPVVIFEVKK